MTFIQINLFLVYYYHQNTFTIMKKIIKLTEVIKELLSFDKEHLNLKIRKTKHI